MSDVDRAVYDHHVVHRVSVSVHRHTGDVLLQMYSEANPRGEKLFLTEAAASVLLYKLVAAGVRHPWVRVAEGNAPFPEEIADLITEDWRKHHALRGDPV